ncbi:hypothetical protein SCUP515_12501 [Seiridium cupressi]
MLPSLTDVLNAIALAPENWKVKRYLDNAKCDSVSADLGNVLSSQLRERFEQELLQSIFDKYCIGNSSQRKPLLNVFQCDRLLGTRELEWYWRNDATDFHRASFERIFRSIAAPDRNTGNEFQHEKNDTTSMLSDAMDDLVMVGPQFMHAMPSTEQLETIARKLSTEGFAVARKAVTREESSALISLLLRLDLRKENGAGFIMVMWWQTARYVRN